MKKRFFVMDPLQIAYIDDDFKSKLQKFKTIFQFDIHMTSTVFERANFAFTVCQYDFFVDAKNYIHTHIRHKHAILPFACHFRARDNRCTFTRIIFPDIRTRGNAFDPWRLFSLSWHYCFIFSRLFLFSRISRWFFFGRCRMQTRQNRPVNNEGGPSVWFSESRIAFLLIKST